MQDVSEISVRNDLPFLCSGTTPHNIKFVSDIKNYPVVEDGRKIRYADPDGVNINFVEEKNGVFYVRTYERGVEDETLACGTGATSVAIACHHLGKLGDKNICHIKMPGGDLKISFERNPSGTYENIYLTGPAKCVFRGEWN
jgi:diaminopimelate epimerase